MRENFSFDRITKDFIENLKIDKPLYEMTPEQARDFLSKLQDKYNLPVSSHVQDVEIFDENAGNITVKLVRPCENEKLPLIIYCHGGGWVLGDFKDFEMTVKLIANYSKAAVAFVEYSHAPEFQYPTALKQIYGALKYFSNYASDYNLDSDKIALLGDSAGANMAAAAAIKSNLDDGPKICCMTLVYPVCDSDMNTESYKEFKNGPWLSKKAMEWFWDSYAPDVDLRKNLFLSLLNAETKDLQKLPPTLILTAEYDVLRDEGEKFAKKLIEAGVKAINIRINNTFHDFLLLNALKESLPVKLSFALISKFLHYKLYK